MTSIPPFHSLPFSAYYRTECQDKYSTSRLAHHVAYDNECASSLQLTPCFDESERSLKPSYDCRAFVHGNQYSRKVRCFGPWVDAAGFANVTVSEISRTIDCQKSNCKSKSTNRNSSKNFEYACKA
mmetsp:Transcript_20794/g.42787  ORF Transcript_20794/g.42787 Transcript_20794/m.42787 type:complete len:126 (-) Transcript_20794:211-588(-)